MSKVNMKVDTQEARLISIHRAIREYNLTSPATLVSPAEAGSILEDLEDVVDLGALETDNGVSLQEIKMLLKGFIAGITACRISALASEGINLYDAEQDEEQEQLPDEIAGETVSGGPTGGVVAGQAAGDPRYVKQTGPRD